MKRVICRDCSYQGDPKLVWILIRTGRYTLGSYCPNCGKWLAWLPQTTEWLDSAPPKPIR